MSYCINPGEVLPDDIKEKLSEVNKTYSKTRSFNNYKKGIQELFQLDEVTVTTECKHYLAGFIEGEGSLNVSIKRLATAPFGVVLDPEFSITQHVNGISNLYLALCVFQTGKITFKSGSNATMVYRIENRTSLQEKVLTFFEQYIVKYGSSMKKHRKQLFAQLLIAFNEKKHSNFHSFVNDMLPIWYTLRVQESSKTYFHTIQEVEDYITNFLRNKKK